MEKRPLMRPVRTSDAPAPSGHYNQGIICGELVFVSGQGPVNPATGEMPDDIEAQVRQTLENIEAILIAAGANRSDIVKCSVFLADIADFAAMNKVYSAFFGDHRPARTTVQSGLRKIKVEIDAVAMRGAGRPRAYTTD